MNAAITPLSDIPELAAQQICLPTESDMLFRESKMAYLRSLPIGAKVPAYIGEGSSLFHMHDWRTVDIEPLVRDGKRVCAMFEYHGYQDGICVAVYRTREERYKKSRTLERVSGEVIPLPVFPSRFDVCEAYYLFWHDNHGGTRTPVRDKNKRPHHPARHTDCWDILTQLTRMKFKPGALGIRWNKLSDEGKDVYRALCIRYGFPMPENYS